MDLFQLENVSRSFKHGRKNVNALPAQTFTIRQGEFIVLKGKTGSGKSTLLNILSGLLRPSTGRLYCNGRKMYPFYLPAGRRVKKSSFVFQDFQLLSGLKVTTNIMLPGLLQGYSIKTLQAELDLLLDELRLSHRRNHYPDQLSGGELQRTAIGRALITRPAVVFADEPTGNLDEETEKAILNLLLNGRKKYGFTLIVASHSPLFFKKADRVIDVSAPADPDSADPGAATELPSHVSPEAARASEHISAEKETKAGVKAKAGAKKKTAAKKKATTKKKAATKKKTTDSKQSAESSKPKPANRRRPPDA